MLSGLRASSKNTRLPTFSVTASLASPTRFQSTASSNMGGQVNILQLPLVPAGERLTLNLLPDPITPEARSVISSSKSAPSLVRRSRPVLHGSHFSYLSPLPLSFPYDFKADEEGDESLGEKHQKEVNGLFDTDDSKLSREEMQKKQEELQKKRMDEIEATLRRYEVQLSDVSNSNISPESGLTGLLPPRRQRQHFPSARLLGVSPAALRDCLPHLDVGDALEWIRAHDGRDGPDSYSSGPMASGSSSESAARTVLSDFLAGRLIGVKLTGEKADAMETDDKVGFGTAYMKIKKKVAKEELQEETSEDRTVRRLSELEQRRNVGDSSDYVPWSLCYAGHQFGVWAGQLGDGRAVTLKETKNPETGERWEIQLKGAGRTPYSRFADGLATLTSSVREYLCSEAMGALGIPTSRALAVIALPELTVMRERPNMAAITTRMCPSWLRIGSFQIHSSRSEWESVRILGEYVSHDVFGWHDVVKGGIASDNAKRPAWARRLVEEVARRNAKTIALWQVYGFMHGVMNTDNIALTGHTIDYGPYAFMDLYDEGQICNHSDGEGRYAFRLQPTMGVYAIRQLVEALAPVIGFEIENDRAPAPTELLHASSTQIDEWRELCSDEFSEPSETAFTTTLLEEWKKGYQARLGLSTSGTEDKSALFDKLGDVLADLDFTHTMRQLCRFPAYLKSQGATLSDDDKLKNVAASFVDGDASTELPPWYDVSPVPEYARSQKKEQAKAWLQDYAKRLLEEGGDGDQITQQMKRKNPSFVLRNWLTNEVANRLEQRNNTNILTKVLEVCIPDCLHRHEHTLTISFCRWRLIPSKIGVCQDLESPTQTSRKKL